MKRNRFLIALGLTTCFVCGLGFTSCSEGASDSPVSVSTRTTENLPEIISADKTLYADVTYVLTGKTYVKSGATLTINAGTRIEGAWAYNSSSMYTSALVIVKGGKIMANGTAAAPIVMTAQNGTKGGWGGLVLLGKATVNQGNTCAVEGVDYANTVIPRGIDVTYGGSNDADNSGVLRYVRVEYAGAAVSQYKELSSFTFAGVGSGTTVDHCQAYQGADSGFEFFGGAVNCKYLVSTASDDDGFYFEFGYRGKIQFAVATINPSLSYSSDPNGIECENDMYSSASTPFTHPVLSNFTIVGTSTGKVYKTGATDGVSLKSATNFRRNCRFTLVNSVLYGYARGILKETTNATYILENNVVCAVPHTGINFSTSRSATTTFTPSVTNLGLTSYDDIILANQWGGYKGVIDLMPIGDPALSGASFAGLTGFEVVTYKGAFSDLEDTWTSATWVR